MAELVGRTGPLTVPLVWARGESKESIFSLLPRDQIPEGMVFVPGGPCILGDPAAGRQKVVEVADFFIDRTEVTGAEYERFVTATGATPPDRWLGPKCPEHLRDQAVYNVSWFQAAEYARWAGKRLPTEAEWEKAARGVDGRHFPWGTGSTWPGRTSATARGTAWASAGSGAGRARMVPRHGRERLGVDSRPGEARRARPGDPRRGRVQHADELSSTAGRRALGGSDYGGSNLLGFRCVQSLRPEKAKPTFIDDSAPATCRGRRVFLGPGPGQADPVSVPTGSARSTPVGRRQLLDRDV